MRQIRRIIVHHSLTKDTETVSWGAIRAYHMDTMGWSDIGYHAGIEMMPHYRYECVYGRPLELAGAHTRGHNHDSAGFCFVGNYDIAAPSEDIMRIAARRVLAPWMIEFDLGLAAIQPHRDFSEKSCPGAMFDMDRLREITKEELVKIGSLRFKAMRGRG